MKLSENELSQIQDLNIEFNKQKGAIGDLELQKHYVLKKIEIIKNSFEDIEKTLIEKYGEAAVVNAQTGEITQKKE